MKEQNYILRSYEVLRLFFTLKVTNLITYGMKYLSHCSMLFYLYGVCTVYDINLLDFLAKNLNLMGSGKIKIHIEKV